MKKESYAGDEVVKLSHLPYTLWRRGSSISTDDINLIVEKYREHPSIQKIISMDNKPSFSFSFPHVLPLDTYRVIMSLNPKKSVSGPFSIKVIHMISDIITIPLTDCINAAICEGVFPDVLKMAKVTPVFKKGEKNKVGNYRPISILPGFSKVYERLLYNHMSNFVEKIFSPHLCGFRSKYSTQHALLRLLNHWHQCLDKSGIVGTVLMDLSKAFDSLDHELLLAKLHAYGFDRNSLLLLKSYLSDRYQKTKIGSAFSEWLMLVLGVPQGSILGPLLFNIFINDLLFFVELTDICNFADDNTIYSCDKNIEDVLSHLEHDLSIILSWFSDNNLSANPNKFQMMLLGCPPNLDVTIKAEDVTLRSSDSVTLLGITIDKDLSFKNHISSLCKKANGGIRCLYRIRKFLNFEQSKLLSNSYIISNFNYAPIIWMFCNKTSNSMITNTHKRALRAITNDYVKDYYELLSDTGGLSIHESHLRYLLTEIYKTHNGINPTFMTEIFVPKEVKYKLRIGELLTLPSAKTNRFGTSSFRFRGSLLWNSLPDNIKNCPSVDGFKTALKLINLKEICNCHFCR